MAETEKSVQDERTLIAAINAANEGDALSKLEEGNVRDFVTGRIIESQAGLQNDKNKVTFTTQKVLHKMKTYQAGGVPQYIDMEFITIKSGNKFGDTAHRPVSDMDKWLYPVDYERFKAGADAQVIGTPLTTWGEFSEAVLAELKSNGIESVEQIINMSEGNARMIPAFHATRQKAVRWLEKHKAQKAAEEIAEVKANAKAELDEIKAQMAEMLALMKGQGKEPKAPKVDK